jgi:TonB family protein
VAVTADTFPAAIAGAAAMRKTIHAPTPEYPAVARDNHRTGFGLARLEFDSNTGKVTAATMEKSTGHEILDESALKAFRRWRFKPGTISPIKVPITFTMAAMKIGAAHRLIAVKGTNASGGEVQAPILDERRPAYPYEARARHLTGTGTFGLTIDTDSGDVTSVDIVRSTGHKILDEAALEALRKWRFKPGTARRANLPITYSMKGASY